MQHKQNIKYLLFSISILAFFIYWTANASKSFEGYGAKYSIFFRNYRQFGVLKNHFFPSYNFYLTDPPSHRYISHSPLVPLIMYTAANIFGDEPRTYRSVSIGMHIIFFSLLSLFVARWWGRNIALWTLFFAALSKYALRYGDVQTPEILATAGGISSIFLYFEWLKTKKTYFLLLCAFAYLVGFAAVYAVLLAMVVILIHWLFFVRERKSKDFLKLSILPTVTIGYTVLMIYLMLSAGIPLRSLAERFIVRATHYSCHKLFNVFFKYNYDLIGPILIIITIVFFVLKYQREQHTNRIATPFRLEILSCLLVSGLFPIMIFGNAYINHPFLVITLLPFFAVSGALGINYLLKTTKKLWQERLLFFVIVSVFLTISFGGKGVAPRQISKIKSPSERIVDLSLRIKPMLKPGDNLWVLYKRNEVERIIAFYRLWIPTGGSNSLEAWEKALISKKYSLVLITSSEAFDLVNRSGRAKILDSDGDVVFFRIE